MCEANLCDQAKEADAVKFRERIATLEHEYKCMHEQLTSEIKLLSEYTNINVDNYHIRK